MSYSSPASPGSPEGPVSPGAPQTTPAGPLDETEMVTGADQLLSSAVSSGLSDPFDPAQGGWMATSFAVDPYSGLETGNGGIDPFTGGLAVDPYAGEPAENDNPNFYTGGQNIDPISGIQNADSFTGGGNTQPASSMLNFGIGTNVVYDSGPQITDINVVYDAAGAAYAQYTYSDGTVAYVPYGANA